MRFARIPLVKGEYVSLRWALKQLLPFKYATGYVHHPAHEHATAEFTTWRMWLGRVFQSHTTVLGRVVETVEPDGTISWG
jgi:hypothetical protein